MSSKDSTTQIENGDANGSATLPNVSLPAIYPTFIQKYTSCRWRLGYVMVYAFVLVQALQNSMSFAIVCMIRGGPGTESGANKTMGPTTGNDLNQTMTLFNVSSDHHGHNSSELSNNTLYQAGEFDYDSETQGLLISCVFFAAIFSSVLGSFASRRFGPKPVVLWGMMLGGVMMLFFPLAARTHIYLAILARILIGFGVNIVCPVTLEFWYQWAPLDEKSQLVAYSFTGFNIANILVFAISGYVCLIPLDNGWPFIFYIFGGLALLWCLLWHMCVYETPERHPSISVEEKLYIQKTRADSDASGMEMPIPWKAILKCRGFWVYIMSMFLHNWNSSILFSYLPTYMETVLNFNLDENGLLSSLPYVTRVLSTFSTGYISSKILRYLSVTHTRKLIQCAGFYIASGLAIAISFIKPGQEYIAVAIFAISTPFHAVTVNSLAVIPLDMAPPYAGMISGFGQALAVLGNLVAPNVVSFIAPDRTQEQWNIVFYMCAGIFAFTSTMFLLFATGEVQPWAVNSVEKTITAKTQTENGQTNVAYVSEDDQMTHI